MKYSELYIDPALEGVNENLGLTNSILLNPNILISKTDLAKYLYYSKKTPEHIEKAKLICNDVINLKRDKTEILRAKYILELLSNYA